MIPDGYELDNQISSTQSAQVWLARNPSGSSIVLKLAANNSRVERRFKREIGAMQLAAGPHVMPVLDCDDSYSWYSMPVAARTLYDTGVPTAFEECLLVLNAITVALNPIHAKGQVHRDLKPQNILWLEDEVGARWVVADFGIVRNPAGLTTEQLTRINGLTGTEGWAAPEQHDDAHESTITADVYAAGAILSWMLTGKRPSFGHVKLVDEPQLRAVLRRATNADPAGRYSNLEYFLKAVRDSVIASTASLESLVQAGDWPRVSSYVGQPNRLTRSVDGLPKLQQPQVHDWFHADRTGLAAAVSDALDDLAGNTRGLPFDAIDKFLTWGVIVLRVLINEGEYDAAERVATALFGATANIHQFKPAKVILDWLTGLNKPAQRAMETALHTSSSWDFFKQQASDRWESKGESDLVQRLRED
ncbi:hypothetical protein QFZ40_002976 [Arthrobacter pascens]|uniref:serine/threonine-protein kinase n=1 Tax=Arthrobacter pascens TaxID=1677 RepID=UPI002783ACCB|nr:serine/threonine-protein kinase [Arthrobacter pascens]MDQ0635067.1 hypothetical protein [Arthrobacter pascens]